MGLRKERLADQVRDILGGCFLGGQLRDPRLSGVTITFVKLSADLQVATVYYRLFDKAALKDAQIGLEKCKGFLRTQLADSLTMRRVPELRFFYDESVERGARVEELLRQLKDS